MAERILITPTLPGAAELAAGACAHDPAAPKTPVVARAATRNTILEFTLLSLLWRVPVNRKHAASYPGTKFFSVPLRVPQAHYKRKSIADALPFPQSERPSSRRVPHQKWRAAGAAPNPPHQFGMGKSKTRMLAWSTITARFVNWSTATPKVADPGKPSVWSVLNGFESVSTMDIVLLAELDVRIAPVCGFTASEVGLM